jgi:hypothetical protein
MYDATKNFNNSSIILELNKINEELKSEIDNIKNKFDVDNFNTIKELEYKIINTKKEYEDKNNDLVEKIKCLEIECERNKSINIEKLRLYEMEYRKEIENDIKKEYGNKFDNLINENLKLKCKNTELEADLKNKLHNSNNFFELKNEIRDELKKLEMFGGIKKGYVMETSVYNLLLKKYNHNGTMIRNVGSKRGCGDIELTLNNIVYMFEIKTVNEKILNSDPGKIFERFEIDSKNAYEDNKIDISVFVSNGSEYIPGHGVLDLKKINTSRGSLILIYVSDIINNPDRVDAVIRLGDIVYNITKNNNNIDDFVGSFESIISCINELYKNMLKDRNEREANFKKQDSIITKQIFPLIDKIKNSFNKDNNNHCKENRLRELLEELVDKLGYQKTTIKVLLDEMIKKQIPQNVLVSMVVIKQLKQELRNKNSLKT